MKGSGVCPQSIQAIGSAKTSMTNHDFQERTIMKNTSTMQISNNIGASAERPLAEDLISQCIDDHRKPWQLKWTTAVGICLLAGLTVPKLIGVPDFNAIIGFAVCFMSTYMFLVGFGVAPGLEEPAHYKCYAKGYLLSQLKSDLSPSDRAKWNKYFADATRDREPITVRMLYRSARRCRSDRLKQAALLAQSVVDNDE